MKKNVSLGIFCFLITPFAQSAVLHPEDEFIREKFAPFRSAYIGDNCRVEIVSTVYIDEIETKKEKSPVYIYEYTFVNRGETRVELSFISPLHTRLVLDPGEERKEKLRTKTKPKIFSARIAIGVSIEDEWSFDGLNVSIIYVPDTRLPSKGSFVYPVKSRKAGTPEELFDGVSPALLLLLRVEIPRLYLYT